MFINSKPHEHLTGKYRIVFVKQRSSSKYYRNWKNGDIVKFSFNLYDYVTNWYSSPPLTVSNLTYIW